MSEEYLGLGGQEKLKNTDPNEPWCGYDQCAVSQCSHASLHEDFAAQAEQIAALESSRRDSWHRGFCTRACAPGHHSSGCYERMINDSKARVAALEVEVGRLKEMNRIQRIALDFDPFAENRRLKTDLAHFLALAGAVDDLVKLLRLMEPAINNACLIAGIHGVPYNGPTWTDAIKRVEDALADPAVRRAVKETTPP